MKRKMWWLKRSSSPHLFARYLMLFCALGVIFLPTSYVWANPAGEQVVGGAATFQRDGNKLTVNQATDRLAVNWQSFNIGAGESTHFNMPSSTSAALNRVIGGNPSSIYGSLSANGILYLINPSGILVGPGGTVNAASFMASTLDVSTEQFMNGKGAAGMRFNGPSGESIVNQGNITAEKGDVFLVAQKVENRGTINAANGTAGMVGSGQATDVMVHEVGGNGFAIRVAQLQGEAATGSNRDLPDGEELMNEGTINAAQAELNASGNVYALAIRNSGTIRAKAVVANADGTVRLDGGLGDVMNNGTMIAKNVGNEATAAGGKIEVMGQNITASPESIITAAGGEKGGNGGSVKIDSQGTTIVQGKVDVTAPSASAKGGKVELLGERVGLLDGAKVDASGGAGGGTVLAGGDYLGGRTPSADLKDVAKQEAEPVKNAKATVMADTAEIKADATVSGDGGKIVLWSDEYTGFYGDLFARGGVVSGNGGFIETSSKDNLQAMGAGIASAANGTGGLWLLDPSNVELTTTTANGSFSGGATDPNIFTPTGNSATVNVATINSSLNSGTSVTIQTGYTGSAQQGNITQATDGGISKTAGNDATLTLQANGSITLTQSITSTLNALDLVLAAGSANNFDTTVVAASAINLQANVTLNGGDLILNNSGTGGINQSAGSIVTSGQTAIAAAGGVVTLTQAGNNFGIIGGTGTTTQISDTDGVILSGSTFSGATTITAGGSISQVGVVKVTAGGLTLAVSASGSNIELSTSANSITGGVTIGGTATNVQDFKLRNVIAGATIPVNFANMTNLRDLTIFYDAAAFQIPNLQQAQATLRNISITANGGAITQNGTGGIVASGTASFTSSGAITVANLGNDFGGAVSATATGANTVSLRDTDDLTLGVISMGSGALGITFGKDLLTNAGLSLDGRVITGGSMTLTPTILGSDIILGANAGNANDIAGAVTITLLNNGNVRDFVLRNVNSAAGTIVNLAGAANLRDVSINYPLGTYDVPTFASTSFRDLSVYANTVNLTPGVAVNSNNGSIELYQADSGGIFTLDSNVNTLSGDIRILSDGDLVVSTGVLIGGQTTGAITLSADAGGVGTGELNLTGTATVGNAQNSSVITLQSASVVIDPLSSILQGPGTVVLKPSTLDADIDLGDVPGGAALFSINSDAFGRIFSSGTVQIGAESQVGNTNIGALSLTSNTFSVLKLVGSSASSALLGIDTNTSWRTFGIGLDFDINVDLGNSLLVIDTTQAGFYPTGADILFEKQVDGDRTLADNGASLSLTAGTSSVVFERSVGAINPLAFLQVTQAGSVTTGKITARQAGLFGAGGLISLTADTITTNGNLNVDAVTQAAGIGDAGGQVSISGRNVQLSSRISANGGDGVQSDTGTNFAGGAAGDIFVRATGDLTVAPDPELTLQGSFSALGGDPSATGLAFGADGTIDLSSGADMFIRVSQVAERETQYAISAGRNLVFASNPDPVIISNSAGGVSFRMNVDNTEVSKQPLTLNFNMADPVAGTGVLFMAPGSSIQTNGGQLNIVGEGGGITLSDIDVIDSPSFNLSYSGTADLLITGSISGQNTSASSGSAASGAVITIDAPNSNLTIQRGVTVQGNDVYGTGGGYAILEGKNVTVSTINASGGDDGISTNQPGRGGEVRITANYDGSADSGKIIVTTILARGGQSNDTFYGGQGGDGGSIILNVGNGLQAQYLNAEGGSSSDSGSLGGQGGRITITSGRDLLVPTGLYAGGGSGTTVNGAAGTVEVTTSLTGADIAMSSGTITLSGNANLEISSAGSVTFGVISSYTIGNPFIDPFNISSGSNLTINNGSVVGDILGDLTIHYGTVDAGARFYMPGSNTIRTTGGDLSIERDSFLAPGGGLLGQAFVGGIDTTLSNGDAGSVLINANQAGLVGTGAEVIINGNILTSGGNAKSGTTTTAAGLLGFNAGSVQITGDSVSVRRIESSGGDSSASSANNASGGTGGGITLTSTGITPTITLQRNLTALGGTGLGTGDAYGGGGGSIQLNGNVVLSSGNSSTSTINMSTSGGAGESGGESGIGGAIVVTGSITGTSSTSNTLQLIHGSGPVILGATPADTITLLELITADPAGVATDSTGSVVINGSLDLTTLTTQGFGYSLSILGGGTIANRVTFLNTGTTTIGAAGVTTTLTDGFDALNGTTAPSTLQLGGTINTVTATTGSMLANTTVLVADTTLNSAGNIIQFGSLDGTYGLTLAAGVAGGNTTFSGAVGDTTQVGQITITSGVTGLVNFASTVEATGIQSTATSLLTFNNDVTLSGIGGATTDLVGTITFNNQAYLDGDLTATLSLLGAGSKTISAATTLSGGPIEFGGGGDYTVTGAISGAQNLILSGGIPSISGAKNFTGDITIGSLDGGPTISMSGGYVSFRNLTTADGIISTEDPKVTFQGVTTLGFIDTNTTLSGGVDLIGTTLTSAGNVQLGRSAGVSVKLDGVVLVNGTGDVTVKGTVTDNAGFTSFTQTGTAGKISFDQTTVTLDVATGRMTLNGNVGLGGFISGTTLSTAGTVILGDGLTDSITLNTGGATLTGTGTFAVNGVVVGAGQDLTLSGTGGKTFAGGVSDLGTLGVTAGTGTFNKTVSGVAFNQSGGVAVLNGNGTFTGASTLGGTSTTLNGITFSSGTTAVTGVLTSTGATTITGGLITLNTASAVTSSSGVLTMGSTVSLGQGTTLSGAGAYKLSGTVNGANSLNLTGTGAKTFSGEVGTGTALTTITQANDSGLVTFADDVTMSGAGAFNANLVLAGLTMTSSGSTLTFGDAGTDTAVISGATTIQTTGQNITLNSATTLNAALTTSDIGAVGGITTLSGTVTGKSSNLTVNTDNLVVGNTVQTGSGVVSLFKKDGLALTVGGVAPGFLNATEISRISTSGGLTVATAGDITINQLALGDTDQITGAFRMVTTGGDIDVAQSVQLNVFSGSALAGALTATGSNLTTRLATRGFQDVVLGVGGLSYDGSSSMSLSGIQVTGDVLVSSVEAMTVNGSVISGAGDVALESLNSNLNVLGTVTSAGSMGLIASRDIRIGSLVTAPDAVFVDAGGYFINSYSGNPFQSADTRIATTDIFGSNWPSNGAVPGLQVVYGVSDAALVQANQIGVSTTLLAGNGAPYVLEFTTGTGQPYIFAQQAAIPPVMLPAALTGGSGFTKAVSYSADEIEMMTPEERSAYENQQRQVSARVILQGESGEGEEIGAPTEGRTPQAAIPAVQIPLTPTAQVLLEGNPLAGAKSDQERGDAKRILKVRPTRAVALRSGLNVSEVIESERMAAEVSVGSAPVVQNR